ncbi:phosphoribosyl-ATP diphosphatase [Halorarum halophilum]|uniref:Phosphoribosyl-ATP pyrophosphatase n=1 Tax=Halorarum halophilum TaxID=2743090 RepID=A0A7D5K2S6_9EURY|nr:phosphoribosyl-ATP diphosphatase [Halobaculum halophilum]QLG29101.1 phosphoribosyl-ATP diphosphatase [Halobaculum halophilum]
MSDPVEPVGDDGTEDDATGNDATGSTRTGDAAVLDDLFATIESRRAELPEGSYTASLFTHEKGENAVLEKLGEEATETILAAKDDDDEALTAESADLVYHLLVLLAMKDLDVSDLRAELRDRF